MAPYGGYGFAYSDTTVDLENQFNSFSVDIFSGGGGFQAGGFQQGWISRPSVIATMNVVRVAFGATLFAYFVENNPTHPRADQEGKPYCVRFGGSMSESFAIYDNASGLTHVTTPDILTISFTVADANLHYRASYPALYKSSRPVSFAFGVGFSPEPRTFPDPYLCIPQNQFAVNSAITMPQYTASANSYDTYASISAVFAGNGIPTVISGSDPVLSP